MNLYDHSGEFAGDLTPDLVQPKYRDFVPLGDA